MKPGVKMKPSANVALGDLGNTYFQNETKCDKKHLVTK